MTTNESAQEVPFLSGMSREEEVPEQKPVTREYTFSIVRSLFNIHGMVHSVADVVSSLAGKVRNLAERGPQDYEETSYARGVRDGARNAGSPNTGGVNGGSKILTALVALNTALLVGVGGWLLATVSRHDRELAVLECQMNPICSQAVIRGRSP